MLEHISWCYEYQQLFNGTYATCKMQYLLNTGKKRILMKYLLFQNVLKIFIIHEQIYIKLW